MTEFEKELVRFVSGYLDAGVSAEDYVKAFSQRLLSSIGQQRKSEVSEDLDAYAQSIEDNHDVGEERGYLCAFRGDIKNAVILGAKWQKEQMMKKAVKADIMLTLHDKTSDISLHTGYLPKELGIKYGDNVFIIIVKEEGK